MMNDGEKSNKQEDLQCFFCFFFSDIHMFGSNCGQYKSYTHRDNNLSPCALVNVVIV